MGDNQEKSAVATQPEWRVVTFRHSELLPDHQVLQHYMLIAKKRVSKRSEPENKKIEHGPELYQNRVRKRQ